MYGVLNPSTKLPRKEHREPSAAEPLYAEAPAVPARNHGEQEPTLVDNDLYDQSPATNGQAATSSSQVALVDNDLYDQTGQPTRQSTDGDQYEDVDRSKRGQVNVALVDNDLYDSNR